MQDKAARKLNTFRRGIQVELRIDTGKNVGDLFINHNTWKKLIYKLHLLSRNPLLVALKGEM